MICIYPNVVFQSQSSGSEMKWVDGGKPLFKLRLQLVSTVYTQVQTFIDIVRDIVQLGFFGCVFPYTQGRSLNEWKETTEDTC